MTTRRTALRIIEDGSQPSEILVTPRIGIRDHCSGLAGVAGLHIEQVGEVCRDAQGDVDRGGSPRGVLKFNVLTKAVTDPTSPDHEERTSRDREKMDDCLWRSPV